MSRTTRGPLPPRIYWFRRTMVLGTAVLLVVAIARLLGSGSDGSGGGAAELVAERPASTAPSSATAVSPSADSSGRGQAGQRSKGNKGNKGKPKRPSRTSEAPVLAAPTGRCVGSDIAVTPEVEHAAGGRDVTIALQLRTISAQACTWRVSPKTLTVRITSGSDPIWSSRHCPRAIPRRDVVVRKAVTAEVEMVWKQAKRSGANCSVNEGWAMPGWYHVTAAALGGDPSDVQFELVKPTAPTVTVTATPKQSPSGKKRDKKPGNKPSGAVEPGRVDRGAP